MLPSRTNYYQNLYQGSTHFGNTYPRLQTKTSSKLKERNPFAQSLYVQTSKSYTSLKTSLIFYFNTSPKILKCSYILNWLHSNWLLERSLKKNVETCGELSERAGLSRRSCKTLRLHFPKVKHRWYKHRCTSSWLLSFWIFHIGLTF